MTAYDYGAYLQLANRGAPGFRRVFPLRSRKDVANGVDYNAVSYEYTVSGHYISEATVTKRDGLTETHRFNEDSLNTGTTVKNGGIPVTQGAYQYGTAAPSQMLRLSSSEKTYDGSGTGFAESQVSYQYSADALGNVTQVSEVFPADPALNTFQTKNQEKPPASWKARQSQYR